MSNFKKLEAMKKYLKIVVLVLLIPIGYSCEDYLNTQSPAQFTEKLIFNNIDFATKEVYSAYSEFLTTYMYQNASLYTFTDSDIEFVTAANNNLHYSLAHYDLSDGNGWLAPIWNELYLIIERANICIDNLPVSPIWEGEHATEAHRLYGEAVTLRAFAYSMLIRLWGDVPFSTKSTQGDSEFYLPKTDRDVIYESLIKDLADVEVYVPWLNETQSTDRINKAFVKGLRARMALAYAGYSLRNKTLETKRGRHWEDYYKIANKECREIIESGKHKLNPSFENIFKTLAAYKQDVTYGEMIFELPFGRQGGGSLGYFIGMTFSKGDMKYGYATPQFFTSPQYYYSFDRTDTRRNVSTELYNYNGTGTNLSKQMPFSATSIHELTKYRKNWLTPSMGGDLAASTNIGMGYPIMRYADVILMYAETENEINNSPTQAAKDALSLVRQRAFPTGSWTSKVVNYVDSVSANKQSFFNAIVDERAWEFGGELIRKFDLVRWNLLGTKIKQMKDNLHKITSDDPKFANVPTYLYWKRSATDPELIEILNPDYRLPSTAIDGYTQIPWLPLWSESTKTSQYAIYDRVANGYNESKNNHLYPIAATLIAASHGVWTNDQVPP